MDGILRILKFCFKIERHRWKFPVLLILAAICHEIFSISIMGVISNFYYAISQRDKNLFLECLVKSIGVITLVSFFKSLRKYFMEASALQWRINLVEELQLMYFQPLLAYDVLNGLHGTVVNDPDQRITQDVDKLATLLAKLMDKLATVPGLILFYSLYLFLYFGWITPCMCYLYFIIASLACCTLTRSLSYMIYIQEKYEGELRQAHFTYRLFIESIAFLRGENAEQVHVNKIFGNVVMNSRKIVAKHLALYLVTDWFSHLGSVGKLCVDSKLCF